MSYPLQIKDKDGNYIGIPCISGADGKSAYEQAVEGGFAGTEEEFIQILGSLDGEHNKPTKPYTGNGGSQTVQIGVIGIVAWLVASNGLQGYVSKNGFMGMNSNGQAANQVASFITFENGVLTLNNGGLCNASGVEYTVQVL